MANTDPNRQHSQYLPSIKRQGDRKSRGPRAPRFGSDKRPSQDHAWNPSGAGRSESYGCKSQNRSGRKREQATPLSHIERRQPDWAAEALAILSDSEFPSFLHDAQAFVQNPNQTIPSKWLGLFCLLADQRLECAPGGGKIGRFELTSLLGFRRMAYFGRSASPPAQSNGYERLNSIDHSIHVRHRR